MGDARLGGISCTLAAYEALVSRGYSVLSVIFVETEKNAKLGNADFIKSYLSSKFTRSEDLKPSIFRLGAFPEDNSVPLDDWYFHNSNVFNEMLQHMQSGISQQYARLLKMREEGGKHIWWPFTQHGNVVPQSITLMESAFEDEFRTITGFEGIDEVLQGTAVNGLYTRNMFDACASWWTQVCFALLFIDLLLFSSYSLQGIGHGNVGMAQALGRTASQFGHVMFPSNLHLPAVELSSYLTEQGPGKGWARRTFYSDDGSTAMEVAVKMALRLFEHRRGKLNDPLGADVVILSQANCYHGDTLGTMHLTTPNFYNKSQHPWYADKSIEISIPRVHYVRGELEVDVSTLVPSENMEVLKYICRLYYSFNS